MICPSVQLTGLRRIHQVASSCAQINLKPAGNCIAFKQPDAGQSEGSAAKRLEDFTFSFEPGLARLMQDTDRSVSCPRERKQ
jgi:hypothetical protein